MDGLSFYDIGGYRENVRRYKEGIEQLCDVQTMIKERVDIETNYSKCLQSHYDKWATHVGGLASSALQAVWRDVLEESMELQRLHANVRDRICDEILKTIALYLKENHHPSAFRASKELREIEDDFERAQRSWRRQYEKVDKAKKAFHSASRAERSAQIQMKNACGDATVSSDIESKYRDRYQKCQDELSKSEKAYRAALESLELLKKGYVSHMNDVFESCQQKELKREKFVFEMLSNLQKVVVDIASASKLNQLHRSLEKKLVTDNSRFNNDLEEWSRKFGPDCDTIWPTFEPFMPSLNCITRKSKKKDEEVVLMKQVIKTDEGRSNSIYSTQSSFSQSAYSAVSTPTPTRESSSDLGEDAEHYANGTLPSSNAELNEPDNHCEQRSSESTNPSNSQTPLSTSDVGTASNKTYEFVVTKDFTPYIAKVLHDYDAQDNAKLSLQKGEEIEVLGGPDELNWGLGKKDGRVGLFPATYVQKI